jgi:hydrogenase nickel incorporation protein HypA/HybF
VKRKLLFSAKDIKSEVGTFLAFYLRDFLKRCLNMHELSVAQSIVEIIQQHIPESDWNRVTAVRLKIGAVAGVVPDSLEFSFQAITAESPFRRAKLEIEPVPFRLLCLTCNATREAEIGIAICSQCGSSDTKILSGLELNITEIELADSETENV